MDRVLMQYDSGSINKITETAEGFLKLTGTVASVGWLEYKDNKNNVIKQYVPKETLFDSEHINSISGSVLTLYHPKEFVSPSNYNKYSVGSIGSVLIADESQGIVDANIVVQSAKAIDVIKKKEAVGLSMGYTCQLRENEDGTLTQVKWGCNHIAITGNPRNKKARLHLDDGDLAYLDECDSLENLKVIYYFSRW
jgi:hypothetical protein